jgi:hypothetical protein
VTKVDGPRLFATVQAQAKAAGALRVKRKSGRGAVGPVPAYSTLTLNAPPAPNPRLIAEIERSGVTLRVFEQTPEMMALLSSACGFGALR